MSIFKIDEINNDIDFLYNQVNDNSYTKFYESLSRTKSLIRSYATYNNWEYFCIFTFNDDIVDRYSYKECSKKIRTFFANYKQRYSTDFEYIVVPSNHNDGAIYFVGMISNVPTIHNADNLHKNINNVLIQIENTKDYYTLPQYNLGFAYITKVKNKNKCAGLMMRRINNFSSYEKRDRLLFVSKNLNKEA